MRLTKTHRMANSRPEKKTRSKGRAPRAPSWLLGAMSNSGEISVGPIISLPAVLTSLGCKPQSAFAETGIDPKIFEKPENRLHLADAGRLLATCAELTNCPHFGLLLGERFQLRDLGALGHLLRNSPSVGDALRSLVMNLHWHDRGAVPILITPTPSTALLGYSVYHPRTPGIPNIYDVATVIAFRIVGELCGPSWRPKRVQFAYRKPGDIEPYRRLFRAPIRFDSDVSGVVFASRDLDLPITGADPFLHGLLTQAMQNEAKSKMTLGEQVQEVLYQMVLSRNYSANAVCSLFGLHERALRRRLAVEGKQLHELVQQTRFELAELMLENTDRPVSEIAATLGYRDPNAFSRAFRAWSGLSPRNWRYQLTQAK